jgi:hypothetical protein
MSLPRAQFTLRRMMAAVAVVAILAWVLGLLREKQAIAEREPCRVNLLNLAIALGAYQGLWGVLQPQQFRYGSGSID